MSEWIDLDNSDVRVQQAGEQALQQESTWACHLGLQAVLLPPPSLVSPNYARVVRQMCAGTTAPYQQLWVRIPLFTPLDYRNTRIGRGDVADGWQVWDSFRFLTGHHHRLSVALELGNELPDDPNCMQRWAAEPVKAIIIPTRIFQENKQGFPVLSKHQQQILAPLLRFRLHIIFTGRSRHSSASLTPYMQYMQFLHTRNLEQMTEGERFTQSYKDTLQSPLQPLMDNLESITYETFERDPIKYQRYESAIAKALVDIIALHQASQQKHSFEMNLDGDGDDGGGGVRGEGRVGIEEEHSAHHEVVITVVGAGRGPLVACALSAAASVSANVRIYAVEKNVHAIVTLRNRVLTERWNNVVVIPGDMRSCKPPELADLLVSELLGSWGDNELSPECLDGAQLCLKQGGISIPCSYTSFVAPLSSNKLWMCAKDMMDGKGLETPFVVKLHNCFQIADTMPLFRFEHPNWQPRRPHDNGRFSSISFRAQQNATMHGLAGTFESCLYKEDMISIAPHSHTPGMFSWFPLFIPLANPVKVNQDDIITVCIWRCVTAHKVWYEWCLTSPICTPIQNSSGHASFVGLH